MSYRRTLGDDAAPSPRLEIIQSEGGAQTTKLFAYEARDAAGNVTSSLSVRVPTFWLGVGVGLLFYRKFFAKG